MSSDNDEAPYTCEEPGWECCGGCYMCSDDLDCEGDGDRDVLSELVAHVSGYQLAEQYAFDHGGPIEHRGAVRACNDVLEIIDDIRHGRC